MSLRDAAVDLCVTRRGIAQERTFLLPTLVDRAERRFTKEEAKLALGIPPEKTVLVSVARAVKYHSVGGVSYAGMHAPVLERHPNAILLAVGPEESDDWRTGSPDVDERIRCIGEVADPRIFFEAGDIYVDSYPFVSSTSMMEAAGYGLPLVTRFDGPDEARIFGINHVGLVGSAIVAHSLQEYQAELSKLILSPDLCQRLGTQAREAIHRYHTPPGWLDFLEALYEKAAELTPNKADAILPEHFEQSHFGEPDCRHHDILGDGFDPRMMMKSYIGMAGLSDRLSLWKEIRRSGAFATLREAARFLMPEWAVRRFKDDFLSRLRAHSGYA
jgi:hypothetical protein